MLYDASDSLWAARAFWALEYLGHRNAPRAQRRPGRVEERAPADERGGACSRRARFEAKVDRDRVADKDAVLTSYIKPELLTVHNIEQDSEFDFRQLFTEYAMNKPELMEQMKRVH